MGAYVKSLRRAREDILDQLAKDREHHAKWLVRLMDIDDELEELEGHDKMRIELQKSEQGVEMKSGRTRGVIFVLSSGEKLG